MTISPLLAVPSTPASPSSGFQTAWQHLALPSEVMPRGVAVPSGPLAPPISKAAASAKVEKVGQAVESMLQAQKRLDQVLALATSGRSFSPAELLAFQTQVYSASQELDLAGKVVEKATSGVKQVLQTQL